MCFYLLPQKVWSILKFSGPKWSFGRHSSADCKSHRSLSQGIPAAVSHIVDNPEFFSDYWGLPVTADENWNWIWIFIFNFIFDVINLFSVTVIAWHSELSTLNFRDSGNFLDWWNTIQFINFFGLAKSKSCNYFRQPAAENPYIWNFYFFWIIEGSGRRKWSSDLDSTGQNTWIEKNTPSFYDIKVKKKSNENILRSWMESYTTAYMKRIFLMQYKIFVS